MPATTLPSDTLAFLELDQRTNAGLTITLAWEPATDTCVVDVLDSDELVLTIHGIPATDASKAFHHPFAYTRPEVDVFEYQPLPKLYQPDEEDDDPDDHLINA